MWNPPIPLNLGPRHCVVLSPGGYVTNRWLSNAAHLEPAVVPPCLEQRLHRVPIAVRQEGVV
jgi:hypothetical protein